MQTKVCCRCKLGKLISLFNRSQRGKYGVHSICKSCKAVYMKEYADQGSLKISKDKYRASDHGKEVIAAYTRSEANKAIQKAYREKPSGKAKAKYKLAQYRALKAEAMPNWVDKKALRLIYKDAPPGLEVDHILPINSDDICGLHVPWNLQYLTREQNASKSNSFDWTYNNEGWKSA